MFKTMLAISSTALVAPTMNVSASTVALLLLSVIGAIAGVSRRNREDKLRR